MANAGGRKSHRAVRPGMRETGKAYKGKKVYFRSPGSRVLVVWDDRTVIEAGSEQAMDAYLAARRGVLPYWLPAKALAAFRDDHFLVTVDAAAMRRYAKNELAARMTPMTPVERAAFASVAPVWEDTTALAAGGRLEEGLAVHAWAATTGPDSSERVRRTAEAMRTLAQSTVRNSHTALQSSGDPDRKLLISLLDMLDRLLENVKSQQQDNEVRLATSVVLGQAKLSGLWSDIAATAQKNTLRRQSRNNLKGVALAMLNYHDTNKHFPPAVLYGPDGKTPYSWRVALLPYLEQLALYREYHFDEPWDGPHNRKLLDKMPAVFRSPDEPATSQNACYFVLAGPGTIFDGRVGTTFAQILDGTSNTILAVEAKRDIPWTKPEDIPYDPQKPLPKLGGYFADGFHVAMADGAVRSSPTRSTRRSFGPLITKADRQPVSIEEVTAPRFRTTPPSRPGRPLAGLLPGGTYTASACSAWPWRKPDLASAAREYFRDRFEIYKSTQQQLLLSRFVLEAALRNPKLAKLPSIKRAVKRGDAVSWLRSQLEVSFPGKAELDGGQLFQRGPERSGHRRKCRRRHVSQGGG